MPAEPNHEYRHTAERLQALETLVAQHEEKRQGDYLREKADMKQRELDQQRIKELEAKVAELERELKERDEHIKGLLEAKASHIGILVELRSDIDELKSKLAIPTGPSALYRQMQALADQAEGNTEEEAEEEV